LRFEGYGMQVSLITQGFKVFFFNQTGRVLGCQSKNHTICSGDLWKCARCQKKFCWKEGSTDLPDVCDNCWNEIHLPKKGAAGVVYETI
jgi:hypothetical protein